MTRFKGVRHAKVTAKAIGRKGLLFALLLAGIGIQGCSTEDPPAAPADAETPAAGMPREDETGADLPDGVPSMETMAGGEAPAIPPALAKAAPSCIKLFTEESRFWRTAIVINHCESKNPKRIRVIWRWASDGACVSIEYGHSHTEKRMKPAYVTEIRGC